jgi:hypothetical protein
LGYHFRTKFVPPEPVVYENKFVECPPCNSFLSSNSQFRLCDGKPDDPAPTVADEPEDGRQPDDPAPTVADEPEDGRQPDDPAPTVADEPEDGCQPDDPAPTIADESEDGLGIGCNSLHDFGF